MLKGSFDEAWEMHAHCRFGAFPAHNVDAALGRCSCATTPGSGLPDGSFRSGVNEGVWN